ncbi:MAG: nitroreductase family protein [Haloechinothrix sp.]
MTKPVDKPAQTSVAVHELVARRWSPRAFAPEGEVSDEQLRAVLEAARWAPSYGNTQPARYLVGRRGDPVYARIFAALNDGNKAWAHRASALLVAIMVTRNEKGTIPLAEYGVGLASENLVLQAVAEGLAAHQMAGFDRDAIRKAFALPDHAAPLAAIAIGVQGSPELLGEQRRIDRERAPRTRLPLGEVAFANWGTSAF